MHYLSPYPVLAEVVWSFEKTCDFRPSSTICLSKSLDLSDPQFLFYKTASTIKPFCLLYWFLKKIKGDYKCKALWKHCTNVIIDFYSAENKYSAIQEWLGNNLAK